MSSYLNQTIICGCCGKTFEVRLLKGFSAGKDRSLDGYPGNPTIFDSVILCPHCGYASLSPSKMVEQSVRLQVFSQDYQKLWKDGASPLQLAALLADNNNDHRRAGYLWQLFLWQSRLEGRTETVALEKIISHYEAYLQDHVEPELAAVLTDTLRQAGLWEEAADTAVFLLDYGVEPAISKVLQFELLKIAVHDADPHRLEEVSS